MAESKPKTKPKVTANRQTPSAAANAMIREYGEILDFNRWPMSDFRRVLAALIAIEILGDDAIIRYIAALIKSSDMAALRLLRTIPSQFGVVIKRQPHHGKSILLSVESWGVLNKDSILEHLRTTKNSPAAKNK